MFFKDSLKLHETLSSFSKRYEKLSRKFWTTVGFEARVSPACLSQTSIFFSLFPVPGGGVTGACGIQLPLGRDHEISFLNSRCEGIRVPQELLVYSF